MKNFVKNFVFFKYFSKFFVDTKFEKFIFFKKFRLNGILEVRALKKFRFKRKFLINKKIVV